MEDGSNNQSKNPRKDANIFSKLFAWWMISFIQTAYKRELTEADLYGVVDSEKAVTVGDRLNKFWKKEILNAKSTNKKPSLGKAFLKTFWREITLGLIITSLQGVVGRIAQAVLLGKVIETFSSDSDISKNDLYIYVAVLIVTVLVILIMFNSSKYLSRVYGMKMKIALSALVYRKALKLNLSSEKASAGYVVNLLGSDIQVFDLVLWLGNMVFTGPLYLVVAAYVMYVYINERALMTLAIVLIMAIPSNVLTTRVMEKIKIKSSSKTEKRVKLMNEIISGVKVIKMYAWEEPFAKLVQNVRKLEIKDINKSLNYSAFSLATIMADRIPTFLTLLVFDFVGLTISTSQVFTMQVLTNSANLFCSPLMTRGLTMIIECKVAIDRIQEFLLQKEKVVDEDHTNSVSLEPESMRFNDITMKNVTAVWNSASNSNTLENISLDIQKGKLYCVVGPVGSGKSSLLQVILKELSVLSGSIRTVGRISYASQDPWIFVGTVRENILFGKPYNREKYRNVIKICALERDLELFPNRDRTLVGERGVSLSGGQRARINLARAVYQDADIYLFDDPLSAVDTRVGSHLFDECITQYLSSKTRILVTHQLQHMQKADIIIVLCNGKVQIQGNIFEIKESGINFTELITQPEEESDNDLYDDSDDYEHVNVRQRRFSSRRKISVRRSIRSMRSTKGSIISADINYEPLEELEKSPTGYTQWEIFKKYLSAGGSICTVILVFLLFVVSQVTLSGVDYTLSVWSAFIERTSHENYSNYSSNYTNDNVHDTSSERITIMSAYGGVLLLCTVFIIVKILAFYKVTMNSSENLHSKMFQHILHGSMRFFDTNPSGRILNRFSKDIGTIDQMFPKNMADALQFSFIIIGVFSLTIITNYWMVFAVAAVLTIVGVLVKIYIRTARSVKQIEGILCSPVFSHVSATLNGLETIRSSGAECMMENNFYKLQDQHTSAWYSTLTVSYAFGVWQDSLMLIFITILLLVYVFVPIGITGAAVGLGISQSLSLLALLQFAVLQMTETLNQLTCVERIIEYTNIEKEEDMNTDQSELISESWPQYGAIQFTGFYLRYMKDDFPVLKNLNFFIESEHKIGIVGRTGAGKSSLITALFRLAVSEGSITIDGIDISRITLQQLRQKISIIPQEPVLFSASLRYNLDPFGQFSDDVLYRVLEEVELKDIENGLDYQVMEGGSNLSVGQRQLVCLARAILRKNKILVLDEATANVDHQTDALIQDTIRKKFKNCTVLTIAHRLNTIMDSDKVMVMDAGNLVEYDHPYLLLQNRNGYFFKMVEESGISMMLHLIEIAKMAYTLKHGSPELSRIETKL